MSSGYSRIPDSDRTMGHSSERHRVSHTLATNVTETKPLSVNRDGLLVQTDSNRTITLKGVNLDPSMKIPALPRGLETYRDSISSGLFWDSADTVSFVGRPFPLAEAATHFRRIKSWGYNTIRYVFTWEAIEHEGPEVYDDDFIDYTVQIMKVIAEVGGLYVIIDPHQDVWSRFTGGSGAPLWTLYAAGLEPKHFAQNEAAFLQNAYPDPRNYPKMVWPSNYYRLATQTMMTMFFAGKMFTPKAVLNGQNIQDYLQDHFVNAYKYLLASLKERLPDLINTVIIAVETMNEPNCGFYGREDLSVLPKDQQLRVDTTPTGFQCMKLGMGLPEQVDTYYISVFGPRKSGSRLIDPQGVKAWVETDEMDRHYGFKRSPQWKLGECVFAQHGVWDPSSAQLLVPDYFSTDPATGQPLNMESFINSNFLEFYTKFKTAIRQVDAEIFLIMQAPVFEIPPRIKGTALVDQRTIVAQHYYDGMSLMFKTWNRKYNVDTLGIMRGRYSNPVFGVVLGEANIRRSIRNQMRELTRETVDNVGKVPLVITETGMPFDMDDKIAYKSGDYSSQQAALDAIGFALEGAQLSHTYWCYSHINCHGWGDRWNNEDFSFWSKDDIESSEFYSDSETLSSMSHDLAPGTRVADAIVRPYAVLCNGTIKECEFDLKTGKFDLRIAPGHLKDPTVVFLPRRHYKQGSYVVEASHGYTELQISESTQVLEWHYDDSSDEVGLTISKLGQEDDEYETSSLLESLNLGACGCL